MPTNVPLNNYLFIKILDVQLCVFVRFAGGVIWRIEASAKIFKVAQVFQVKLQNP